MTSATHPKLLQNQLRSPAPAGRIHGITAKAELQQI
jgi:hypothetical protein